MDTITAPAATPELAPIQVERPRTLEVRHIRSIALIAAQMGLVLLLVHQFQLESRTFFNVMLLAALGFVVHALLPLGYRLPFFAALSLASIVLALGVRDGLAVIALGLVLIGLCHLPAPLLVRVALLVATTVVFALSRTSVISAPWSLAVWPILASMFMFRLALYMYALRHHEKQPTLARTLAYFFMVPNVCFPLYPVVDYSTFTRTYYDRGEREIYETGVRWIVRGLVHLILYRIVYLKMVGDPLDLKTLGDLVTFLLGTFLLYLRVSGQFHLIVGVLHLFGFRLPETHLLYYLASGFTDFWRRINIYWKDFMMKMVYYPSFFWLRRRGNGVALIGATIIVFLSTWVLHSYQWFWLRGGFPLTIQDGLFWSLLGVFVVVESLREMKNPPKRRLGAGPLWSAGIAVRRVVTFTAICVLWSLWSAASPVSWLLMWTAASTFGPGDLWLVGTLVLGALLVAGRPWSARPADGPVPLYRRASVQSTAILAGLVVVGYPTLYAGTTPGVAAAVASVQRPTLNAFDETVRHKGYYEKLDNESRMTAQLWDLTSRRPAHWLPLTTTSAYRRRSDFLRAELVPGVSVQHMDQPFTVNRWGMRDREHALGKSQGATRIAVLGPSMVMGGGVADGETFPDILQDRLNAAAPTGLRYEVLNFGVSGYCLLQQLAILEDRVLQFGPDVVFVTDMAAAQSTVVRHLLDVVEARIPIPFPGLEEIVRELGVRRFGDPGVPLPFDTLRDLASATGLKARMPYSEAERRLRRSADRLVAWTLQALGDRIRQHGAVPVFVALNIVSDAPVDQPAIIAQARAAGFVVFNLLDVWQGRDYNALQLGDWDNHQNAAGNRLIAERLFELIQGGRPELRALSAPVELTGHQPPQR